MTTAGVQLMSRISDEDSPSTREVNAKKVRFGSVGDAAAFAMVGIALVGFGVETLDVNTDDARGVAMLASGAVAGAVASMVYRRVERRAERLARVRVAAWSVVRFFVAFELVRYGIAKIVNMQFYPRYYRLDTRAVDLSGSALAWTFFGHSYAFQPIGGVLEILGAVLLCFRRTALLGALVLVPVMTNIVLVDFFFDVSVRLFSTIYLVMCIYILAPEARRFFGFVRGEAVPARAALPAPLLGRMTTAFVVALVLLLPAADIVHKAWQRGLFRHDALEGAWIVERQSGTSSSWEKLYLEKGAYGSVRLAGRERVNFKTEVDESARTLRLFGDHEVVGTYTLAGKSLHLEGARDGAPFTLDLVRDLPR
jgi:hypothetical protein